MKLTTEQSAIVNSTGNIKINAVAGSGKTSTLIQYCAAKPKTAKILYLAFNQSVKLEAVQKFSAQNLTNVQVKTAHGLAKGRVFSENKYRLKEYGKYSPVELAEALNLTYGGDEQTKYVLANHILKYTAYYCNSAKEKVNDLNYLDTIYEDKTRKFVAAFLSQIKRNTRVFLARMNNGELPVTHDFYLKKFQLMKPKLSYDYILFDEGQDSSEVMLEVFLNQACTKVIVGDTHQQIYGWRYAVNSLEQVGFKSFSLTTSFRFGSEIAECASEVLKLKELITDAELPEIKGAGSIKAIETKGVLARTNVGLLEKAIEYVSENRVEKIYFEGNIHSYTFAEDGTSIYDVLNLSLGKRHRIKSPIIKSMKTMQDLKDYTKKIEDHQLGLIVKMIDNYGEDLPNLIKQIKDANVTPENRGEAEMIFSTLHKAKGQEYDAVLLANDFITKELVSKTEKNEKAISAMSEEVNMLYVAITRARKVVQIPESLVPEGIKNSAAIQVIKLEKEPENEVSFSDWEKYHQSLAEEKAREFSTEKPVKSYSFEEIRKTHSNAYKPWTERLDDELTILWCDGLTTTELAAHFGRNKGAIRSRIKKLELEEKYG